MLEKFREIYNKELEYCEFELEKIILSTRYVRMFVYEVCKNCVKEETKQIISSASEAQDQKEPQAP